MLNRQEKETWESALTITDYWMRTYYVHRTLHRSCYVAYMTGIKARGGHTDLLVSK